MAETRDHEQLTRPSVTPTVKPERIRVLSLTGGGYRGLFTIAVLAELEQRLGGKRVGEVFDVFAGTSIGGLVAAALAAGVDVATILAAVKASGKNVFPRRRAAWLRRLLGPPVHDPARLKAAIRNCLGSAADTGADALDKGLMVTSLSGVSGEARLFLSRWFGQREAASESLADICLATSAAPTFFPPHRLGVRKEPMLDGGLVANAPDLLAIAEIERAYPGSLNRIHMLSVGTAGVGAGTMAGALPRNGLGWGMRIVPLMMSAQERLAEGQARELLRGRYLRVNHLPAAGQAALAQMDTVDDSMTPTLLTVAKDAAEQALRTHGPALRQLWG